MKGKRLKIKTLQNDINEALLDICNRKYKSDEYIRWIYIRINSVLEDRGLEKEMYYDGRADKGVWMKAEEAGVEVKERLGELQLSVHRNKLPKYGPGNGYIYYARIKFPDDIQEMTVGDLRYQIFESKREKYLRNLEKQKAEAEATIEHLNEQIKVLREAKFR